MGKFSTHILTSFSYYIFFVVLMCHMRYTRRIDSKFFFILFWIALITFSQSLWHAWRAQRNDWHRPLDGSLRTPGCGAFARLFQHLGRPEWLRWNRFLPLSRWRQRRSRPLGLEALQLCAVSWSKFHIGD